MALSNGMESPAFNVRNTNWRETKELIIEPGVAVSKIGAYAREADAWGDILDLAFFGVDN